MGEPFGLEVFWQNLLDHLKHNKCLNRFLELWIVNWKTLYDHEHLYLYWSISIVIKLNYLKLNSLTQQHLYIAHRYDTYIRIFIIGDFNIQIYIIPYMHGLELHVIFTDWTDTEDIYIYIYCGSPESGGIFYNRTEMCVQVTKTANRFEISSLLEKILLKQVRWYLTFVGLYILSI